MRIGRRGLLQALLAGFAAAGIPLPVAALMRAANSARAAAQHLRSARALGRAYLEAYPEDELAGLVERWPDADREALLRDIHSDFERADVVWVKGWLLARSEARYCALLSRDG